SSYYDTTANGILYKLNDKPEFTLRQDVIDRNIFVRTGKIARLSDLEKTRQALTRMSLIRYVTPIASVDSTDVDTPRIDYIFQLVRNLKLQNDGTAELTYSNIAAEQRRSLFGAALSFNYRDLN